MKNLCKILFLVVSVLSFSGCKKDPVNLPSAVTLFTPVVTSTLLNDQINLVWSSFTDPDFEEYKVYRHTSSGLDETTGTLIHVSTSVNDTSFIDSIPHNTRYFYRVYVKNSQNLSVGSNVVEVNSPAAVNDPEIHIYQAYNGYLNSGDELWLYFNAVKGKIYKIKWFDSWFPGYSVPSIFVGGYREDQSTVYFNQERIIQMCGSAKTLIASADEKVYLKIRGYDNQTQGNFGIFVDTLDRSMAAPLTINFLQSFNLNIGESKLLYFNSQIDTTYSVTYVSSAPNAPNDQVCANISAYSESSLNYFKNKYVLSSAYPVTDSLLAVGSEKVYMIITGAYFGLYPTSVNIKVEKN